MPSYRHHDFGDLYVKLTVAFPETIDPAVIPSLEAALPPRKESQKFAKNVLVEEVSLSDLDARQQREQQKHDSDAMDEDGPDGEPRVQCANQ
jgi:DnaJ family protein A protein 2